MIRDKVRMLKSIGHLSLGNEKGKIYFRNNENPFGTEYNRYPSYSDDGLKELPETYLEFIQELDINLGAGNQHLNNTNIIFTQGAASGFEQVIKAFFEPNSDSILLTAPYFSVYSRIANIFNITVREIPLISENYNILDIDKICSSEVKGVVLCDPNNPVGSRIDRESVRKLIEQFKGLIIIDEAYVEYSQYVSNLSYIKQNPNVLVLRTMSKALGMAGLRVGAIIGHCDLIEAISRVQLPFSISSCAAKYAYSSLKKKNILLEQIALFKKERNRLYQALLKLPFFSHVLGKDCGFLAVRTEYMDGIIKLLHDNHLEPVFKPEQMNDWIRISVGTPEQNNCLIQVLKSFNF